VTSQTVLSAVAEALRVAGRYNRDDKVAPTAVLWPDPDRTWLSLVPKLRTLLPLAMLGGYDEDEQSGPAIWLRCLLGGTVGPGPRDEPWVVYLPGVARPSLRAIESCAPELRPIAELQFRAAWWQQPNGTAWTPAVFLRSREGLGLDLARDAATQRALDLALDELVQAAVDDLRERRRIDAGYLNSLLNRDATKTLLDWLNDPEQTRGELGGKAWNAFLTQCRTDFGVNPEKDGELVVAERLGLRQGAWDGAWRRFEEAPRSYPRIPELLSRARPAQLLFEYANSWPQDNEHAETALASALAGFDGATPAEARARIDKLELEHAARRQTVWAKLGQAELAVALTHVTRLAEMASGLPTARSVTDLTAWYADEGWRIDEAAMAAIAAVTDPAHRDAVSVALMSIYWPWLDGVARRFQEAAAEGYPGMTGLAVKAGDCVVFVDGLRYDVGQALRAALARRGCDAGIVARLAPFPTVTGTGKPAVAPVTDPIIGGQELSAADIDGRALTGDTLRSYLRKANVQSFGPTETGDPSGKGWTAAADIDTTGHNLGRKLADRISREVEDVAARVYELLAAGWKRVLVVTDHGWILVPVSLPKNDLAEHLTVVRKARCARLTVTAQDVNLPTVPWTWDKSVRIVSPRGAASFQGGRMYEHGGLSPQECVIPLLTVTTGNSRSATGRIDQVKWLGMRCRIDTVDTPPGSVLDIRRNPGDAASSVVPSPQSARADSDTRLLVEDDVLVGVDAYVVLLSERGEVLAQVSTRVGG
jgi:hypothetical protein